MSIGRHKPGRPLWYQRLSAVITLLNRRNYALLRCAAPFARSIEEFHVNKSKLQNWEAKCAQ